MITASGRMDESPFGPGDPVRIIDSHFDGYASTVAERTREPGVVRVNVTVFCRRAPIDVEARQLRRADAA